ncbi:NAD(P)-dependent dehydrogenase (short-subunit alcohol dehydrogenase family) [Maritimibacter alkaliphilus HTCC2654]|uniref:Short-chain dehydrogenase/reductase SDR n=1 Tax=Maritimibacter alkaliphilus HTCC2654 TaxID=314271 RepID=A3VLQ7_9RHOB|nr:SDR family oxidoreductase [Maritimibacter alkaliphilus]EAQ10834.1 Short-chain dehydrogenase/reductase SDR [Rhodobacterales bacterium HTCC2654] [Maritimibacter alkaliphilus HTCC2654]TYP80513.1 NAD(P)-dependent dehydrogenase (short-subunit alcohol dehydrogenase family) [Maritimibacter alkaliphilus HTCC2654]
MHAIWRPEPSTQPILAGNSKQPDNAADIDTAGCGKTVDEMTAGGKAHLVALDVTSAETCAEVVAPLALTSGKLHILINTAGIMIAQPIATCTLETYQKEQKINLESVWIGCKTALELSTETEAADGTTSIINLSSTLGVVGERMFSAYTASKGAVRLMSKALAVELGPRQIRVNSVHPTLVNTALAIGATQDLVDGGVPLPYKKAMIDVVKMQAPLGRYAEPHDIANAIAFLASDESSYITSTELVVDGGPTAT